MIKMPNGEKIIIEKCILRNIFVIKNKIMSEFGEIFDSNQYF